MVSPTLCAVAGGLFRQDAGIVILKLWGAGGAGTILLDAGLMADLARTVRGSGWEGS
jgi:hypothetical protein